MTHCPHDAVPASHSDELSCQCLPGVCKTVREIGEKHHHLYQYRADCQHHISISGGDYGNAGIYCHNAERADEKVGIEAEIGFHATVDEESGHSPERVAREDIAIAQKDDRSSIQQAGILGDEGARSDSVEADALEAEAAERESHCQDNADEDIAEIDNEVHNHRVQTVLHTDEPALERHQGQCCRSRPYSDMEISLSQFPDFRRAFDEEEGEIHEDPLNQDADCGHGQCHAGRTEQCISR